MAVAKDINYSVIHQLPHVTLLYVIDYGILCSIWINPYLSPPSRSDSVLQKRLVWALFLIVIPSSSQLSFLFNY